MQELGAAARPRRDHDRRLDARRRAREPRHRRPWSRRSTDPFKPDGGLAVLRGNLAPRGAVIKVASADPALLRHRGRAVVFEDVADLGARIDDPALDVDADSVLVLRNAGPMGASGHAGVGHAADPEAAARGGVRDMVRISDARMSGTAFGTVVLHVAPEAAAGGPLAAVRDGDAIVLDIDARTARSRVARPRSSAASPSAPPAPRYTRGLRRALRRHVLQADEGCDFDFLAARRRRSTGCPTGIFEGWIGGW